MGRDEQPRISESWDPVEEQQAHERLQAALFGRSEAPPLLDRYRLIRKLGEGGNGVVWEGHDPELDREVAIKLVRIRGTKAVKEEAARLEREAKALARLSHPHVLPIYDVGRLEDRGVFLVTECVDGQTLDEWLETPRDWVRTLDLLLDAASGLAAAHRAGLVHRDLKPANVMVDADGRARVLDFGLARQAHTSVSSTPTDEGPSVVSDDDDRLTRTGAVAGTPAYMAPEQDDGGEVDARSDQFSFCVTLYEALEGRRPYQTASERRETPKPPPMKRSEVPRAVQAVIARGLSRDPDQRFADMDALRGALRRARTPRWPKLAGVGLAVAAIGFTVLPADAEPEAETGIAVAPTCDASLTATWNPERATAVREAMLATGIPYASTAAPSVDAGLDDYTVSWSAALEKVREETDPTRAADMCTCLRRKRGLVEALVTQWLAPTPEQVEASLFEVESLPRPKACLDPIPRPPSPIPAPIHEQLTRRFDDLHLQHSKGDTLGAIAGAKALHDDVMRRGDRWLAADVGAFLGEIYHQLGRFEEAEATLISAYEDAVAAHHDDQAAGTAVQLVEVVGMAQGRFDDADEWIRHAESAVERANDRTIEGMLAKARAGVMVGRGDYEGALEQANRAVRILSEELGPFHPRTAAALAEVGSSALPLGRLDEAEEAWTRARDAFAHHLGPEHLHVAKLESNLGGLASAKGDTATAEARFRRSLKMVEDNYGEQHEAAALSWLGLADAVSENDPRRAIEYAERCAEITQANRGLGHQDTAYALFGVGVMAQGTDDERALEAYTDSISAYEATGNPDDVRIVLPLAGVSEVAGKLGDDERSAAARSRGLALCGDEPGPQIADACGILRGPG